MFGEMEIFAFQYNCHQSMLAYVQQYELTFSCHFHLKHFPFDSHKCRIEFGNYWDETKDLNLSATNIILRGYPTITTEDDPIIINNLSYPYKFQLESLPAFEIDYNSTGFKYSFTGVLLTLERNSIGYLMVGYYYPTAAFALLSMISYLIDADIVRF